MKKISLIAAFFLLLLCFSATVPTETPAYILDFSGGTNGDPIPQTYGDEPNIDVSSRLLTDFGDGMLATGDLVYYNPAQYSGLVGVAYGENSLFSCRRRNHL